MCFFRKKIDLHFTSTAFIIESLLYHNLTIFSTLFYGFLEVTFIELDGVNHAFILSRYQSADEQINKYMTLIDTYLTENL